MPLAEKRSAVFMPAYSVTPASSPPRRPGLMVKTAVAALCGRNTSVPCSHTHGRRQRFDFLLCHSQACKTVGNLFFYSGPAVVSDTCKTGPSAQSQDLQISLIKICWAPSLLFLELPLLAWFLLFYPHFTKTKQRLECCIYVRNRRKWY